MPSSSIPQLIVTSPKGARTTDCLTGWRMKSIVQEVVSLTDPRNMSNPALGKKRLCQLLSGLSVDQILDMHCDIGIPMFHLAADKQSLVVIKCLLEQARSEQIYEMLIRNHREGYTTLYDAASEGHGQVLAYVLDHLTSSTQRVNILIMKHESGDTAFHAAARRGHMQTLGCMLKDLKVSHKLQALEMENTQHLTIVDLAIAERHEKTAGYLQSLYRLAESFQEKQLLKGNCFLSYDL